jgi:hypothetical protein
MLFFIKYILYKEDSKILNHMSLYKAIDNGI